MLPSRSASFAVLHLSSFPSCFALSCGLFGPFCQTLLGHVRFFCSLFLLLLPEFDETVVAAKAIAPFEREEGTPESWFVLSPHLLARCTTLYEYTYMSCTLSAVLHFFPSPQNTVADRYTPFCLLLITMAPSVRGRPSTIQTTAIIVVFLLIGGHGQGSSVNAAYSCQKNSKR